MEEPSLLDLILSNEEGAIQNLAYHPGLGDSDHVSLTFDLTCHTDRKEKTRSQPNCSFTDSYGLFVETLNRALEGVYMNKDAIALKNKKQKLWKKYVVTRSMNDYNKFVKCKNDLR